MNKHPPMTGFYNIKPDSDESVYEYHLTVKKLPSQRKFLEERAAIAQRLLDVVERFLFDRSIPQYNEILAETFGKDAIGEYCDDRTMCFFVGDLDAFTPPFIHTLQSQVLGEFPLWRLEAQFEGHSIGVYPDAVWLGDQLVVGNCDEAHPAYKNWLSKAAFDREQSYGPLSRQLAYVKRRLPEASAQARVVGHAVLGVFDRYRADCSFRALWVLQTARDNALRVDCQWAPIRSSAVDDEGSIFPQYCPMFYPATSVDPPFWLVTYPLKGPTLSTYDLRDSAKQVVGQITVDDPITDEELKELLKIHR
ncbi:MAG: hypothetical protein QM775_34400 [Pirellulales bacterium]